MREREKKREKGKKREIEKRKGRKEFVRERGLLPVTIRHFCELKI